MSYRDNPPSVAWFMMALTNFALARLGLFLICFAITIFFVVGSAIVRGSTKK